MNSKRLKILSIIIVSLGYGNSLYSQWKNPPQQVDSTQSKFDYHLTLSSGVVSNGFSTAAYTAISPSVTYNLSSKISINAGFSILSDIGPHGYEIGKNEVDLSPRRETQMVSGRVSATYHSENLLVKGTVFYVGGTLSPAFSRCIIPTKINSFGGTVSVNYKTEKDNILSLNVAIIRDKGDFPLLYNGYMHSPFSTFGNCYNPFIMY